jgi:hypothetical protein
MRVYVYLDENLAQQERSNHTQNHAEHPAWKKRAKQIDGRRASATSQKNQIHPDDGSPKHLARKAMACRRKNVSKFE